MLFGNPNSFLKFTLDYNFQKRNTILQVVWSIHRHCLLQLNTSKDVFQDPSFSFNKKSATFSFRRTSLSCSSSPSSLLTLSCESLGISHSGENVNFQKVFFLSIFFTFQICHDSFNSYNLDLELVSRLHIFVSSFDPANLW